MNSYRVIIKRRGCFISKVFIEDANSEEEAIDKTLKRYKIDNEGDELDIFSEPYIVSGVKVN